MNKIEEMMGKNSVDIQDGKQVLLEIYFLFSPLIINKFSNNSTISLLNGTSVCGRIDYSFIYLNFTSPVILRNPNEFLLSTVLLMDAYAG